MLSINVTGGTEMAIQKSDKRKAYETAWSMEHMLTVGCKLRREIAEEFKAKAAEEGTTASALLTKFVYSYLGKEKS